MKKPQISDYEDFQEFILDNRTWEASQIAPKTASKKKNYTYTVQITNPNKGSSSTLTATNGVKSFPFSSFKKVKEFLNSRYGIDNIKTYGNFSLKSHRMEIGSVMCICKFTFAGIKSLVNINIIKSEV